MVPGFGFSASALYSESRALGARLLRPCYQAPEFTIGGTGEVIRTFDSMEFRLGCMCTVRSTKP